MTAICPSCGLNLEREKVVSDGPFSYDPHAPAFTIDGERMICSPQIREMLGSLIQSKGRTMSYGVLAERLGSETNNPAHLLSVLRCRAKAKIAAAGHPSPIEHVHGAGLRWNRSPAI